MGLDLILIRDCTPRETLTDGELMALANAMSFHEALHEDVAENAEADAPPDDDIELEGSTGTLRLGDLREQIRRGWPKLAECTGCPLNVSGRAIGCHLRIDYPVEGAAERWVARAASAAAQTPLVAESLLSRTPVATPAFRDPSAGMFESSFAPWVEIPWEASVRAVSLDAFWDLLLAPRSEEDGVAAAAVLTRLQAMLDGDEAPPDDARATLEQLAELGMALRVFVSAEGRAGYAVSG